MVMVMNKDKLLQTLLQPFDGSKPVIIIGLNLGTLNDFLRIR